MVMVFSADIWPFPREGEDPYSMEGVPEDLDYQLKMKDGIIHVYKTAEDLKQERPHRLPYPDIETFAIDLSHVLAMIADGPTQVSQISASAAALLLSGG